MMKLKDLKKEAEDIILWGIRSSDGLPPVDIIDGFEYSNAWLLKEEDKLIDQNKIWRKWFDFLNENNLLDFSGACAIENGVDSAIYFGSEYNSPKLNRLLYGISGEMPGFGSLDHFRFTMLHEIGHYFSNNIIDSVEESKYQDLIYEAISDGFAISWAVKNGSDPNECVNDVGLFRAGTTVTNNSSIEYQTYGILKPASDLGLSLRNKDVSVDDYIKELYFLAEKHMPSREIVEKLKDKSWEDLKENSDAKFITVYVNQFLDKQKFWTDEKEEKWWKNFVESNKEEAPVVVRSSISMIFSNLSKYISGLNKGEEAPINSEIMINNFTKIYSRLGLNKEIDFFKNLNIDDFNPESHVLVYEKILQNFKDPYDERLKESCDVFLNHLKLENVVVKSSEVQSLLGDNEIVRPYVLIDIRKLNSIESFNINNIINLIGNNDQIRALAVVSDDIETSKKIALHLKIHSDKLNLNSFHMDNDILNLTKQP